MVGSNALLLVASSLISFGPNDAVLPQNSATPADATALVKRLDADVHRRHWYSYRGTNQFEAILVQLIKLGSSAEKPLQEKLRQDDVRRAELEKQLQKLFAKNPDQLSYYPEEREIDRLSNDLELLTALRRVQKKPDPLAIEIIAPQELKAIPGKLPAISVKLKSVDVEKRPCWVQLTSHFHGTNREAQWRFEVRNAAGKILPIHDNHYDQLRGGGIKTDGWLKFGDHITTVLPMGDFIDLPEPGEYTVTLLYHSKLQIADFSDNLDPLIGKYLGNTKLDELIIFRSPSFPLTVTKGPKLSIESKPADHASVKSLIAELPNDGLLKVVAGAYYEDLFEFLPPDSPAGKILLKNWRAVPALLDSLSDARLSRHRKAWVLAILFSITAEEDLDPTGTSALPAYQGQEGKHMYRSNWSDEQRIVPAEQDALIAKWQAYRKRFLDIRVSERK